MREFVRPLEKLTFSGTVRRETGPKKPVSLFKLTTLFSFLLTGDSLSEKNARGRVEEVFSWIDDGYSSVINPLAGKTIDLCSSTWQNQDN